MFKRILITLLLLSSLTWGATATLTGRIQSPSGAAFNGQIAFQLPFAGAIDRNCAFFGSCLLTVAVKRYPVVNGAVTPAPILTRNGDISPGGTYYRAYLYDEFGRNLQQSVFVIPAGATTFDIGAALQTVITTNNVSFVNPGAVDGNNTWTGNNTYTGLITFTNTSTVIFNGTTIFNTAVTLFQNNNIAGGTISGTDTFNAPAGGPFAWLLPAHSGTFMDNLTATAGSCATSQFNVTTGELNLSNCAPLASPVFTGDPQAPTPTLTDSDTSIATTAFVKQVNKFFHFATCDTGGGALSTSCVVGAQALPATQPDILYDLTCTVDSGVAATGGTCANANSGNPCGVGMTIYNKSTTTFGYILVNIKGVSTGTGAYGTANCVIGHQ